ncbi:MAG: DUF1553 domain-containing protein, partial [Phycisphaerae bacterium]|nr:DUF1553 domain-containing protein [Phycisphaerae bacterium]
GEPVPRRLLPLIAGRDQPPMPRKQSGRLELARWIAGADHPLTARVIVNRLWRWHFGRGIVSTPDNFGRLGKRPTHPDLLDHLASKLIASNWSLKSIHRQIMLSATYRQSSISPATRSTDPENKLFARWKPRRVEAEVLRDAILSVSNRIDLNMGGSMLTEARHKYVDKGKLSRYARSTRRTIYLPVIRSGGYDDLVAFDFADPSVPVGHRRTSTVTPQALYLMNGPLVHRSSDELAGHLLAATQGQAPQTRAAWMIRRLYGREDLPGETERAAQFVVGYADALGENSEAKAWAALARVLIASNEFLYIH